MPKSFEAMTLVELDAELALVMEGQHQLKLKQRQIQAERSKKSADAGAEKLVATLSEDQKAALQKALGPSKVYVENL